MYEAITMKDMAKALGVSVSTVSRAIRNTYGIKTKTKKLVLAYAKENNYRPNPIALSLKERKSKSIGVIVTEIANTFLSQVINGIESTAYTKGYNVIITQSHESYKREINNAKHLSSRSVDGLLVALSTETENVDHFKKLHEKGLPIVFFDRITEEIKTHKVIADNYKGGYDATMNLINSGFKKIAHITSSPHLSITKERLAGYKDALRQSGLPIIPSYIKYCNHGGMILKEVEISIKELISLYKKPDAIVAASDRLTMSCLSTLNKLGIVIPKKMALVGFSNSTLIDLLKPSITSIDQPAFEMGQIATELLIQLIESKRPIIEFETRILPTKLVKRVSSSN